MRFEIARLADRAVIERTDDEMHFIEYDPLYFDERRENGSGLSA